MGSINPRRLARPAASLGGKASSDPNLLRHPCATQCIGGDLFLQKCRKYSNVLFFGQVYIFNVCLLIGNHHLLLSRVLLRK
jgi:hypothetical protein